MYQNGLLSQNGNIRKGVGYFFLTGEFGLWGWVTPSLCTTYNFNGYFFIGVGIFFIWTGI
jgi:hypothetical protein